MGVRVWKASKSAATGALIRSVEPSLVVVTRATPESLPIGGSLIAAAFV